MSEKKYEYGTVAMLSGMADDPEREEIALKVRNGTDESWRTAFGMWDAPPKVRPLIVIDPEDADEVDRFREIASRWADRVPYADAREPGDLTYSDAMQQALREYAKTSAKPEEPTGVGAVVREGADVWVLVRVGYTDPWRAVTGDDHRTRSWDSFSSIVEVLSEGVQQ